VRPMTPHQIEAVQASFAKVAPIAETAAALFYRRLFETAPELRTLFKGDIAAQGRKLMSAIATVVDGLGEIDNLAPAVRDLAGRHLDYGVRREHYDLVGAALLWTLAEGLGAEFTPAIADAWAAAYEVLSGLMIAAAYGEGGK
jgi:hemoglobin-like flavoprotein